MSARFNLLSHPTFTEPLSKEDLYVLEARGSIGRSEIVVSEETGNSHTVGELLAGMRPPRALDPDARIGRPAYKEIRADEVSDEHEALEEEGGEDDSAEFTENGERIHHHSNPSWLRYGRELLLTGLLLMATPLLYLVSSPWFIATASGAAVLVLTVWIARSSHEYLVTEERVEHLWGIIGRSSHEVRICDIRSIDVHERGIAGALGLGTVDFSSAANAGIEVSFRHVRDAHDIKVLVRGLQKAQSRD